VPSGLLKANQPASGENPAFARILSENGEGYLDTAWPIFEGKAGTLRLGFSEGHYRRQLASLWLEIGGVTLGILLVALMGALIFVRRITRPLAVLVQATRQIDGGEPGVRVELGGQDEIAALATSFNHMVARQEDYTAGWKTKPKNWSGPTGSPGRPAWWCGNSAPCAPWRRWGPSCWPSSRKASAAAKSP